MKKKIKTKPKNLQVRKKVHAYEEDFCAWSLEQAKHLKKKEFHMLDFEHLIEEIQTLGASEKRALKSYLAIVLIHMLKIKYQSKKHTRSWDFSIKNSRLEVKTILKENPSLKRHLNDYLINAYNVARVEAEKETGLDFDTFPEECPWTIKEVLGE